MCVLDILVFRIIVPWVSEKGGFSSASNLRFLDVDFGVLHGIGRIVHLMGPATAERSPGLTECMMAVLGTSSLLRFDF